MSYVTLKGVIYGAGLCNFHQGCQGFFSKARIYSQGINHMIKLSNFFKKKTSSKKETKEKSIGDSQEDSKLRFNKHAAEEERITFNKVCDRSLLIGLARKVRVIDTKIVIEAIEDLR
jgi:hypothetical protein